VYPGSLFDSMGYIGFIDTNGGNRFMVGGTFLAG
jgi:hypothetical protein